MAGKGVSFLDLDFVHVEGWYEFYVNSPITTDKPKMPLRKIQWTRPQSAWALWHITETEADLAGDDPCPADITNPIKRLEWQAGRAVLQHLAEEAGLTFSGIWKDNRGKPFLKNLPHHISLSHSYPYVAAQLSSVRSVGIDIEQPKEKLLKVAHRVFSSTEMQDAGIDPVKNCIYWCAKEALYKIYGKRGMSFIENLRIEPFDLAVKGIITGKISMPDLNEHVLLSYEAAPDYVLVATLIL